MLTIFVFEFPARYHFEFPRRHAAATIVKKQLSFVCNNMGNQMMSQNSNRQRAENSKVKICGIHVQFFSTLKLLLYLLSLRIGIQALPPKFHVNLR